MLKKERSFYGNGHKFFEIPWQNAVDIDNKEDLEFAQCVLALRKEQKF
jgi:CMP-N-acetylneuraminic acid synthetase